MFLENVVVKKAIQRGKAVGHYHLAHGQPVRENALLELARAESYAFAHTSRFYSSWAPRLRPAYEKAFVAAYSAMMEKATDVDFRC